MGWKKLFVGEKMPDKDNPKYKQRYENEVNAGRKFARMMKLDVLAGTVQNFANNHRKQFLVIVFGLIIICLCLNIYRMAFVFNRQQSVQSATERQELILRNITTRAIKNPTVFTKDFLPSMTNLIITT